MHSLEKIIKKSITGNRHYQEKLYDLFCDMVMGICTRYSQDASQADDMFQESFLNVLKNLKSVKVAEALPGWIKRCTINTCLNHLKKETIYMVPLEKVDSEDHYSSDLLDQLGQEQIILILNSLPSGYRSVMNLYIIDGFSHKEISEQLGITESTSRSQLTYAKKVLKDKLRKIGINKYESVI